MRSVTRSIRFSLLTGALIGAVWLTPSLSAHDVDGHLPANRPGGEAEKVELLREDRPASLPGKVVRVFKVTFAPGAAAAEHHHPGPVTVIVLEGELRSQLAGQEAAIYRTGDSFFEPAGVTHLVTENPSIENATVILAIHIDDEGAASTVFHN